MKTLKKYSSDIYSGFLVTCFILTLTGIFFVIMSTVIVYFAFLLSCMFYIITKEFFVKNTNAIINHEYKDDFIGLIAIALIAVVIIITVVDHYVFIPVKDEIKKIHSK